MSLSRLLTLIVGPVGLIGASYWLTLADAGPESGTGRTARLAASAEISKETVCAECRVRASQLMDELDGTCRVIVRAPYVLAGDLSEDQLDQYYDRLVQPIERALTVSYFDRPIDQPVTIVLASNDKTYRKLARRLDEREGTTYYGYYEKADRRVVLNIATGYGTLAHEMTHALGHFDFPDMPEWFDEGLASLHEESRFSDDGLQLVGVSNWRFQHLVHGLRKGNLRSIQSLITQGVRRRHEPVDYAHARYLCLYLQDRGLLPAYYRKFRAATEDPTGLATLCRLLDAKAPADVDQDFRQWLNNAGT